MKDYIDLIARIFIAFIFLFEAYGIATDLKGTKQLMTNYGITWQQDMLLYGCLFLMVLGSVLVLIGYRSSFGAVLLLMYFIPITFIVHSWWNDPLEIKLEQAELFIKNFAIIGGLLMVVVNGSGRFSVRRLFATTRVP